jgi:general secretion pathway protein D
LGAHRFLIVTLIVISSAVAGRVGPASGLAQDPTNAPPAEEGVAPLPPTEDQAATNEEDAAAERETPETVEQPERPAPPTALVPTLRTPPAPQPTRATEPATIEFEFQGASINAILEWYAKLTSRSIISAPNLAGTINFRSQTKLTKDEAIQALDSVLAINNIAAIPLGDKFLKIVQINTAAQEGIPVGRQLAPSDTLGTQIIALKYAEAADVVAALQPYLHPYGKLLALVKSNSILISETAGNLRQMLEIVAYVDQPSALRMEMRTYVLTNAKAADVVARLTSIIQEAQQAGAAATTPGRPGQPQPLRRPGQPAAAATVGGEGSAVEGKVIMTADDRTNKILVLTRPSNFKFIDDIIAELDARVEPDVVTKVIELQYAAAEDVASLLNSLISGSGGAPTARRTTTTTTSTGARAPAVPPPPTVTTGAGLEGIGFLQFAAGLRILPDPRTNSLLVMATKEDLARIEKLVQSVDTPVAQVEIEVVIAEVTLNNELDVGMDVFKRLFDVGQASQTGGYITDGNSPVQLPKPPPTGGIAASELLTNIPSAAALAAGAGGLTYFTTFRNLRLDAVIHALASTSKSKVLSTPVIMTMDNQEADIIVGESVPVPVSTVSSLVSGVGTLSTGQLNANIEYKDVAIELKVTPRINPDGYVRMDLEQKVNDLGASVTISGTTVPTILKREAKSSIAVQDGSTIMLGGLIKENKTKGETKVPILGDIPFFGQAFKGQTNNKQRNELIIFIRPTVLRTDQAAVAEARRRSRILKAGEELGLESMFSPGESTTNKPGPKAASTGPLSMNEPGAAPAAAKPATQPGALPSAAAAPATQPRSAAQTPAASPAKPSAADIQSAKVKALKMQDADTAAH